MSLQICSPCLEQTLGRVASSLEDGLQKGNVRFVPPSKYGPATSCAFSQTGFIERINNCRPFPWTQLLSHQINGHAENQALWSMP